MIYFADKAVNKSACFAVFFRGWHYFLTCSRHNISSLFEAILCCVLMNNGTDTSIKVPVVMWAVFDCIVSNWFCKGMLVLRTQELHKMVSRALDEVVIGHTFALLRPVLI